MLREFGSNEIWFLILAARWTIANFSVSSVSMRNSGVETNGGTSASSSSSRFPESAMMRNRRAACSMSWRV